jgi:hypothetical protein
VNLYPIQYRPEVETAGSSDIAVAACRQQQRANSAGVAHSSADKFWKQLNREGLAIARCTVERPMWRLGLQGLRRGTPRTKNGPALAGYGAITMANALKKTAMKLPTQLWQSLTWGRGKELFGHARFTIESGVKVLIADPRSPWQRCTSENTNGLLRQYFPNGTDLE